MFQKELLAAEDKAGVGIINATKKTYQLLTRIPSFVSNFELPNGHITSLNILINLAQSGRCVAIFLHENAMKRQATIERGEKIEQPRFCLSAITLLRSSYLFE